MKLFSKLSIVEWLVVLVVCGLLLTITFDDVQARIGARDGRNDAVTDIAGNVLGLKYSGKPPACRRQMIAIYEERYGISLEFVGGCCPSAYDSAYNEAYNDRMYAAIRRNHPEFDPSRAYDDVRDVADSMLAAEWNARHR